MCPIANFSRLLLALGLAAAASALADPGYTLVANTATNTLQALSTEWLMRRSGQPRGRAEKESLSECGGRGQAPHPTPTETVVGQQL